MIELNIKPLSVNQAWQGRRFKTVKYDNYIKQMMLILPKITVPNGDLSLSIEFGLSSRGFDIDNGLKPFIDCLQKRYGFNDSRIYKLSVEKVIVKKGGEFIKFKIYHAELKKSALNIIVERAS